MWDLLRPRTKSQDVMVQSQQNTVIKASCNIVKQLDKLETMKETVEIDEIQSRIDLGTNALGLLGHYNRQTNVKRRENHKPDLDFQYHHLCTPSQPYSEFLYGDDVTKNVQEIQNVNRVGRKISSDHQYDRGRGFGIIDRGVGRGRGGNRGHGGRRGGFDCGSGRGRGYDRDGGDSHNAPTKNFRSLQRN